MRRRERPIKRTNPSGKTVYVARWTARDGTYHYGWKPEIPGTYALRREAQDAIDACYEREDTAPANPATVGGYAATWTTLHPRAKVTDRTNRCRVNAVLDVKVEGVPLRDWPFDRLRRRHGNLLIAHMLTEQGRAHGGVVNILGTLSAMTEDAIDDEAASVNPFKGLKVRKNDVRIQKRGRPVRVFPWEDMHAFARACAVAEHGGPELRAWRRVYAEPMVRCLSDLGLRAGELLALCRSDLSVTGETLSIGWTVSLGEMQQGTKNEHGELDAGRIVPVPPGLLELLDRMPKRIDGVVRRGEDVERLLFPTPRGCLWNYSEWSRCVWQPGRAASGMDIRPHECRHSWVSLMRAAGVDVADLADVAGHTVDTATKKYTHGLGRSFETIRGAVGAA